MKNNSDMHPEDLIYNVRIFIKELAKVQDERFESLVDALELNKKGEEWLWDYIFNSDEDTEESFEEYLDKYGFTYGDLLKENIPYGTAKDEVIEKVLKDLFYQNSGWRVHG